MKRNFLILGLLFMAQGSWAVSDRFGSERIEIPRSSFTYTTDRNVMIATVTVEDPTFSSTTPKSGGSLVLRGAIFSGVVPSTITFFDDIEFDGVSSTKVIVNYIPSNVGDGRPVEINFDLFCSSGILYDKIGLAPVLIKWDWLSPRKSGDPRQ